MAGGVLVGVVITESEWLKLESPSEMFQAVADIASNRKFMLCYVASARELIQYIPEDQFTEAVDWVEKIADEMDFDQEEFRRLDYYTEGTVFGYEYAGRPNIDEVDFQQIISRLPERTRSFRQQYEGVRENADRRFVVSLAYFIYECMLDRELREAGRYGHIRYHNPEFIRDVFGNSLSNRTISEKWPSANSCQIAQGMYNTRNFSAMPILVDALEDAGCDDAAILAHCRDPQAVHVRGCWVVDLVLGQK